MGRPSGYSQELADVICAAIAEGRSVRSICLEEDMPAMSTIFLWLRTHKEFSEQYARAKEMSADTLADEMLDIADDGSNDWMERDDGKLEYQGDHVQRSRLRIDTRKWIASKLKPKKYGDKLTHEGNSEAPIHTVTRIELVNLDGSSDSAAS